MQTFMADSQIRLETTGLILLTAAPSFAPMVVKYLESNRTFFEPWLPELPATITPLKSSAHTLMKTFCFYNRKNKFVFFFSERMILIR
jgi:hypothetical protein